MHITSSKAELHSKKLSEEKLKERWREGIHAWKIHFICRKTIIKTEKTKPGDSTSTPLPGLYPKVGSGSRCGTPYCTRHTEAACWDPASLHTYDKNTCDMSYLGLHHTGHILGHFSL